jgi:transglutaminase-like putative cysteine protease
VSITQTVRTRRPTSSPAVWIDVAVISVLSVIGLAGFASTFGDTGYLLAGLGGLVVGTGSAMIAAHFRLGALTTALVVLVAYFVFGSALAMPDQALFRVLPTAETLAGLAVGAVFGWADIVTLATPVAAPDYIGVLPYVAAWLVGVIGATLAARWFTAKPRTPLRSAVALAAPLTLYAASVLLGTEQPYLAATRGLAFAVIALVWMAWRPASQTAASRAVLRRRLLGVGAIGLVAVTVGATVGFVSAPSEDERFVLRERIQPPFDPRDYPSPLAGFRLYTKDLADTVLFSVTGLEPDDRIRLAAMDAYDGRLWSVAGADQVEDGSGSFELVGRSLPLPALLDSGDEATVQITIVDYADVWLPTVGYQETIDFSAGKPASTDVRYNAATGIGVVTSGVHTGMTYEITALRQAIGELGDIPVADVALPVVDTVPDIVPNKANELAGDAESPFDQLTAIAEALKTNGFLSHGLSSDQVPSRAGHGFDRIDDLLLANQWVGDEEQYASAFALMARALGYPARVVMGFAPEVSDAGGTIEVTGSDVTAWVEVAFEGVGWVPFDPTPDNTEVPPDDNPQPQTEPQSQVRQPPRSDTDQGDVVSPVELEDTDDPQQPFTIPEWVWVTLAALGIPALLIFGPMLLIAFLKSRRRARRRAAGATDVRAAGAWDELVDSFSELGYRTERIATRKQTAQEILRQHADEQARRGEDTGETAIALAGLGAFASRTDDAVFSGREVAYPEVDGLWSEFDRSLDTARASVTPARRLVSRYRFRSRADVAGVVRRLESLARRPERAPTP